MQKAGAFKTRAHSVRRFNILTRVPFYKQYLCHGIDSIFVKWPSTQHSAGPLRAWPPGLTCTMGCTRHQNGPLNILCSLLLCLSCSALPYASVALLWLPLISLHPSLCVNKTDSVFNLNLCTSFPLFRTRLPYLSECLSCVHRDCPWTFLRSSCGLWIELLFAYWFNNKPQETTDLPKFSSCHLWWRKIRTNLSRITGDLLVIHWGSTPLSLEHAILVLAGIFDHLC